jgi:hypothetical protein
VLVEDKGVGNLDWVRSGPSQLRQFGIVLRQNIPEDEQRAYYNGIRVILNKLPVCMYCPYETRSYFFKQQFNEAKWSSTHCITQCPHMICYLFVQDLHALNLKGANPARLPLLLSGIKGECLRTMHTLRLQFFNAAANRDLPWALVDFTALKYVRPTRAKFASFFSIAAYSISGHYPLIPWAADHSKACA